MPSDPANSIRSVGSYLRETRESRGVTLEEAARITRIGKNYLSALEEERYDAIPNTAYVKGFLRAYAAFLGLSGDEIIGLYEKGAAPPPRHHVEEKPAHRVPARRKAVLFHPRRWIVSLILLILVIVAAYLFEEKEPVPPKPSPPPTVVSPPPPILPPRSAARLPTEKAEVPTEKGKEEVSPATVGPQAGGIVLKLKVNQDCWLNITIDDTVSQQYNLKPGDLIEWKGEKSFLVDIGNAGGVEAELDGKPLKPLGESGRPAHLKMTAGGIISQQEQ